MTVLGIETAGTICSVGLAEADRLLAEIWFDLGHHHDRVLSESIRHLTRQANRPLEQIAAIAVSAGPGSFTGLRIGIAVAKGLAFAEQKPMIAVSTLQAQAFAARAAVRRPGEIIVPVTRSRKSEIYTAKFCWTAGLPERLVPDHVMVVANFPAFLQDAALLCGDGVPMLRDAGLLQARTDWIALPEGSARLGGGVIAWLGQMKLALGETVSAGELEPMYVQEFIPGVRATAVPSSC
ncbi:MAG: tRNA (adenosine(37)-N6)-threonylcarbamoyltransferase complex dimerization subunit type 1 TsaB [candidate division KSB1 bacterium]|nr:tRNA (adenosine(37)-N6)-threonylcarbamoyltransferase complex dimerization subunit type 1 TsaB [candidate division KSB1 bacterium]MDZ7275194.1 tRNA (adenosine(37)-N6)-threonylcarbamoyltransferase complex dimerization subunit type 1 TsaB [candidate division KSB1 bacterium]MDZ7287363.1 tRNA (adenosine(37)-N6)-threonylcarbamoyltransferase complex dimerization subunit type 1 TsaB [candidate division KSB1 bacterium]MDZ7299477.1 tRNA (adenosine(37)-N6)-threonylcarbamoyltransferase complex dimerizati